MQKRHMFAVLGLVAALVLGTTSQAEAQRSGRYELEYDGPVMGGATGVGATFSARAGDLRIELPAVVRSYPAIEFVLRGGLPAGPTQAEIGSGLSASFTHPDLAESYVAERGVVRITDISGDRIRGDFAIVASPAGAPGTSPLTFRGRFEAQRR